MAFSSDDAAFGGMDRVGKEAVYSGKDSSDGTFKIYIPCRTAIVLESIKEA